MKVFQENIETYTAKIVSLQKVLNRVSFIRLLVFVISVTLFIVLFRFKLMTALFIFFPIALICFAFVIKYYDKIAFQLKNTSYLKDINESEIKRVECNLENFDDGEKFIDQNHPYTSDLDIFGRHSIFQLINRTTTESGSILLSEWLSAPASNNEISDRQKAIKEVSQKAQWRQDFQAAGMHFQNKKSAYLKLLDWVEKPVVLMKKKHLYIAAAVILPILLLIGSFFFYANLESSKRMIYLYLLILVLVINFIIIHKIGPIAESIVETSSENLNTLRGYRTLINHIEKERFDSRKLEDLQSLFKETKYSAYYEINKICKILDFSHQRPIKKIPIGGNYMYHLFNNILLLDIYLILATEKWKIKNKANLKLWAEVVSEFEVINSFAGFCYSNPSFTFPEITELPNFVHFEKLGHPLIPANNRVCNDFYSKKDGHIVMITGSNMGGKSTFLRTVGVNIVLALAGAPCCAENGRVTNLNVFTSMRTQDNLLKGVSSFYAELNRIEKMLKMIESNQNVFFLLDEMFKGTNSKDRHKGGYSLITQLSKLQTSGIIATHDIELAKLTGNKKLVTNYSFNSEIINNTMLFSYELDPFICKDFNASELMKNSGINILSNISDALDG